jgi:holo-[acyl-carrier protein] synthase
MHSLLSTTELARLLPAGTFAIGNDLVALAEFRHSCTAQFVRRVFTPAELAYCAQFDDPVLRYASTWAAKEAVYKALKQLFPGLRLWWRQIEISRDKPAGRPLVSVPKLEHSCEYSLTVSHDGALVWAVAVIRIP